MKRGQTLKAGHIIDQTKFSPYSPYETRANVKKQGEYDIQQNLARTARRKAGKC